MSQYRCLPMVFAGLSLLLLSTAAAQSGRINRVHHGTEGVYNAHSDSSRIISMLEEADALKEIPRLDSAGALCRQALQLSLATKDSFLIAMSYYELGQWALAANRIEEALAHLQTSLNIRFEKEQSSYTAGVYNDLGYLYGGKGEMEKQREWYLRAMRIYDRIQDSAGMSETLSNLSSSSLELGDKPEAVRYGLRALAIRERGHDNDVLALSCNNLAHIYLQTDSIDKAIHYQQEGLRYAALSGSKRRLAQSYTSMSLLLNRRGKNAEALEYEKKAIGICQATGDSGMLARRYLAAAMLSSSLKDSAGALGYFDLARGVSTTIDDKFNLRDIYLYRAVFFKERKDFYQAYESLKKYHAYKDSIIKDETATNIAEIQARYETEKKDKAIGELRSSERIHQLEIEKQKAVIAGNLAEAQRKENEIRLLSQAGELQNARIQQQEAALDRNELEAKSKEQELRLARAEKELKDRELQQQKQTRNIIIGSTMLLALIAAGIFNRWQLKKKLQQQAAMLEMRNHIARDLHDELGSTLTSIHILSQVSRNHLSQDEGRASSLLEKITEQSRQMQQSMSDIVWAIRSDNDKIENMMVRMREFLAQTLEAKDIAIKFGAAEELLGYSFSMQQRKDIFLIFKEAVNNAAKYARCTEMEVSFKICNGRILLEVKDNGVGFDPDMLRSTNGLNNMRVRSASLAGHCHIQARPGEGTTVLLDLPMAT